MLFWLDENLRQLGAAATPLRRTLAAEQNILLYNVQQVNDKFDSDLQYVHSFQSMT